MPANQKSIQLLLFRKYTHCYPCSTKGRLNHGLQCSITILIYCHITDPYSVVVSCMCTYVHAYVCVPVWIRLCIRIYAQVSSSLLEYVKIYHRSCTLDKHSSLAIFDKHLLRLTNQGLPKILPQYPLETALTVT